MSLKRLILLLVVLGALAGVLVGFAAGSGGSGKLQPKSPVERSRAASPNSTEKYWTPERMKHAKPPPMGIPGGEKNGGPDDSGSSAPAHP